MMAVRGLMFGMMLLAHQVAAAEQLAESAAEHSANQAAASPCARVQHRPCVALVLGGGGARGGAHLAVLRQLEAQQIPVDLIVGTSIGAFVGGLYAQGKTPAEIEKLLLELPWSDGFRDRVERDEVPARRKDQRDQFPINLDLGVGPEGLRVPKGVLHGQAMAGLLQRAYGLVPELSSFDQLAVPFRAVATDLTNREAVVLSHGNLLHAVQASMSIPGVVRPMMLQNHLLVDGGVANNLPISVAKALGAEHVIAVSIDSPLLASNELNSAMAVTEQLTNFLVAEAVSRQMALLGPGDVLIQPQLKTVGTLDFDKMPQAIAAGQVAVTAARTALGRLSQPALYAAWQQQRVAKPQQIELTGVALENHTSLDDQLLLQRLNLPLQQPVSLQTLQQGVRRIYGLDMLERVSSTLQQDAEGKQRLLLKAEAKSWGPAYLNFRFALEDDFENTHNYQLAASHLWTGLSAYGAELQNVVALGTDKQLASTLYWPLGLSGFYSELQIEQSRTVFSLEDDAGRSGGELNQRELTLRAALGWEPIDPLQISVGLQRRDGRFRLPAVLAQQLPFDRLPYLRRGTNMQLSYDTLNSRSFPSRGVRVDANWQHLNDDYLSVRSQSQSYGLQAQAARQWQSHILRGRLRFDRVDGPNNLVELDQFSLGGLLNLSGYPKNFLFGSEIQFASLVYQYQWPESRLSLFKAPFYLGTSLERGLVRQSRFSAVRDVQVDDWIWAGSIFAGWDSPFGPLYLGYGQADSTSADQPYRFYLSLGQTF